MELENIINKLDQNRSHTQCFIDGALVDLPEEKFIEKVTILSEKPWKDYPDVLGRISEVIIEKKTVLVNIARNRIHQTDSEIEKDIQFCSEMFAFQSCLSRKIKVNKSSDIGDDFVDSTTMQGFHGMILDDCPIFTTLSLLTAAPIASGKLSTYLFVNSKYSAISVCFAAILIEAGLPKGIVNVVPHFDERSLPLLTPHDLDIFGVIPAEILNNCQFRFSKIILKKNSPNPIIVLKSADIDSAVDNIVSCTQSNEVFWFPNVIYVEEPCYEKFVKCLEFVVNNRNASYNWNQRSSGVDQRLEKFLREKKDHGVKVVELIHRFLKCVFLINDDAAVTLPTISDEEKSTCHRVISIIPIRTMQEALSLANSFSGGIGASVWTNDALEMMSLPYKLKYGTVWVNSANRFSPVVPFTSWSSGYGTFTGKRGFFDTFRNQKIFDPRSMRRYESSTFPKKDISPVVKQSLSAFATWHKLDESSRASFLRNVSILMENVWQTRLKKISDEKLYFLWRFGIDSIKEWVSYTTDKVYEQSFHEKGFQIVSRNEPLGVIAILAHGKGVGELLFVISAALMFGNTVIVGILKNEEFPTLATELENLFKTKPGLVSVLVDTEESLRDQFTSNSDISSVWMGASFSRFNLKSCTLKDIFQIFGEKSESEMLEISATRPKSIWFPSLC
ncbi:uncharacterized protein LOC135838454 [Planococcus citri]|uniref:uncharacterized protein LOC135838454 n=1 Tax=Planococcus citri TaxID=170843 RepID=UPI0031F7F5C5